MMQTQDTAALDALQPVVTITTTDSSLLLPALLVAGASVMLKRDKLSVRGLTAAQVAGMAAAQLVSVTDLTSSTALPFEEHAVLTGAGR
jgi:hypothetical protein